MQITGEEKRFVNVTHIKCLSFIKHIIDVHEDIKDGPNEQNFYIFESLYREFIGIMFTLVSMGEAIAMSSGNEVNSCQTTPGEPPAG